MAQTILRPIYSLAAGERFLGRESAALGGRPAAVAAQPGAGLAESKIQKIRAPRGRRGPSRLR